MAAICDARSLYNTSFWNFFFVLYPIWNHLTFPFELPTVCEKKIKSLKMLVASKIRLAIVAFQEGNPKRTINKNHDFRSECHISRVNISAHPHLLKYTATAVSANILLCATSPHNEELIHLFGFKSSIPTRHCQRVISNPWAYSTSSHRLYISP